MKKVIDCDGNRQRSFDELLDREKTESERRREDRGERRRDNR